MASKMQILPLWLPTSVFHISMKALAAQATTPSLNAQDTAPVIAIQENARALRATSALLGQSASPFASMVIAMTQLALRVLATRAGEETTAIHINNAVMASVNNLLISVYASLALCKMVQERVTHLYVVPTEPALVSAFAHVLMAILVLHAKLLLVLHPRPRLPTLHLRYLHRTLLHLDLQMPLLEEPLQALLAA
jgi:hypothetical protein